MASKEEVSYFGPGPAKIPHQVLLQLQNELVQYKQTKISVLELSHRSSDFADILKETESLIRSILDVPSNYKVLFLQGGGVGQFAAVPLNLMSRTGKADYIVTGSWSAKAAAEARQFGDVNLVLPTTKVYNNIPLNDWNYSTDASYVYYCDNETVHGIEFPFVPESPHAPLVCDMSSNFFSRPVDVAKFGVIFGGAQKNIGAAGVTVVIVREDLLGFHFKYCPSVFNYSLMVKNNSILNTPPTFGIHVVRRVLQHLNSEGGIDKMAENAKNKSRKLYEFIDSSNGFFQSIIDLSCRSRMNVVFRVGGVSGNEGLEKKFVEESTKANLLSLKGHRSVGGIRASIYNAVSIDDVSRLLTFMATFYANNKEK